MERTNDIESRAFASERASETERALAASFARVGENAMAVCILVSVSDERSAVRAEVVLPLAGP